MAVNRIAKLLAWLYGDGSARTPSGAAQVALTENAYLALDICAAPRAAKLSGITPKQRRLLAAELKRIRAIRAQHPGVGAKIVGVQMAGAQPTRILIQVSATPSARMSGAVDRLKRALAEESALQGLRLLMFTRQPLPKRR